MNIVNNNIPAVRNKYNVLSCTTHCKSFDEIHFNYLKIQNN